MLSSCMGGVFYTIVLLLGWAFLSNYACMAWKVCIFGATTLLVRVQMGSSVYCYVVVNCG